MFNNTYLARFAVDASLVSEQHGTQVVALLEALEADERFAKMQMASLDGYRAGPDDDPIDDDENFWPKAGSWMEQFRPYKVKDGILIIPIKGCLLSGFPYQIWDMATGYEYIWKAYERGMADSAVNGIALDVDSPGGEVQGNFDLVDRMYAMREQKPVRSFANESMYSAAYSIGSIGDKIVVGRTGGVGSIGVVTSHVDYSKMLEKAGIKITFIKAGAHKTDGNPYEPLPASVEARIQKRINKIAAVFFGIVARNRSMEIEDVRATEALTYPADEAIKAGLADEIGPMDSALAAFTAEAKPKQPKGFLTMTTKPEEKTTVIDQTTVDAAATKGKEEGIAAGTAAGAKAAKDRISGILALDEAKTRPVAAHNVAMDTELTVEQAKGFLAKMPVEGKVGKNGFEAAMASTDNPELGSGAADDKDKPDTNAQVVSILGAQAALRGKKRTAEKAA